MGGSAGKDFPGVFGLGHVDDEWVGQGPAFHLENPVDGGFVVGIGAESVDGFGGEGDQAACAEVGAGALYVGDGFACLWWGVGGGGGGRGGEGRHGRTRGVSAVAWIEAMETRGRAVVLLPV